MIKNVNLFAQFGLPYIYNQYNDLLDTAQDIGFQSLEQNGTIFTIGETYEWGLNSFGFITTVRDTQGNAIHQKNFLFPNYNYFSIRNIVRNSASSIMGVGYAYSFSDSVNGFDLILAKFDNNGDTLFTKIFQDTGSVAPYAIIPYYNNTFLLLNVHAHDYNDAEFNRTNLMVIDSMGNIIKSNYTSPSMYFPYFLLHNTLKHELYALGNNKSQPGNSYYFLSFLRCFDDTSLNLKFTRQNVSNFANSYICGAAFYEGSIYATYSTEQWFPPSPNTGNILKLYKFRFNGQTLQKTAINFEPPDTAGNSYSSQLMAENGKIIFAGSNSYTGFNMYFVDTTLLSKPCLAAISPPDFVQSFTLYDIALTRSKKIIMAGRCWIPGQSNGHWQALSEDYRIFLEHDCGQFVSIEESDSRKQKPSVYPNPSSGLVWIETERSGNQDFQLFNAMGQSCSVNIKREEDRIELDLKELPSGIYFCHLGGSNQEKTIFKIIKSD